MYYIIPAFLYSCISLFLFKYPQDLPIVYHVKIPERVIPADDRGIEGVGIEPVLVYNPAFVVDRRFYNIMGRGLRAFLNIEVA